MSIRPSRLPLSRRTEGFHRVIKKTGILAQKFKWRTYKGELLKKSIEEEKIMTELPLAAVDRIIRKASGRRVSENAAQALAEILEEIGIKIAREASTLAEHAGRRTVRDSDIRLAAKRV